ncbi:MAG: pyridoxal-dependent decarboxylase [Sphingomonadales bacterium]|nr:pyridoxal-dependent decarboxylase [Sphingomonadales bacterium]
MDHDEFRRYAHQMADWMADYLEHVGDYPVRAQVSPGEVDAQLPHSAPAEGEDMAAILADFERIVLPGVTHWQHPDFLAYFPANSSPPSVLGEMAAAALAANGMLWETAPAATELEIRVLDWLRDAIGLPEGFAGSIQTTASEATLNCLIAAREQATGLTSNATGLSGQPVMTAYCSAEAHSSVEKAMGLAGLGRQNLRAIETDDTYAMRPEALDAAIADDLSEGRKPIFVTATLGTTGVGGIDPLPAIAEICRKREIWLHVDAAWAGSALILPEQQWMIEGIEAADSFVFNPHKWLLTNFDCSALYVRDPARYVPAFEILPEYLKSSAGADVVNFRDWGIPLGRRFRALKLWFVLRAYGLDGLRDHLRRQIGWTQELAEAVAATPDFEVVTPAVLGLFTFRYRPEGTDGAELDVLNLHLVDALNKGGKVYVTQTKARGRTVIRVAPGAPGLTRDSLFAAWDAIKEIAAAL